MNKTFSLIHSIGLLIISVRRPRVEFLLQEIIELTPMRFGYCEAEVRSSSVSIGT